MIQHFSRSVSDTQGKADGKHKHEYVFLEEKRLRLITPFNEGRASDAFFRVVINNAIRRLRELQFWNLFFRGANEHGYEKQL